MFKHAIKFYTTTVLKTTYLLHFLYALANYFCLASIIFVSKFTLCGPSDLTWIAMQK